MTTSSARWWKSVCEKVSRPSLRRKRQKIQVVANVADIEMLENRAMMSAAAVAIPVHQGIDGAVAPTTTHQASQHDGITSATSTTATPSSFTLTATATSSSTAKLSWNATTGQTGYYVDQWTSNGWVTLTIAGASQTSITITGLTAGHTYTFDIGAYNSYGTLWSNMASVTTSGSNNVTVDHPAIGSGVGGYSNVQGSLFGTNGPKFTDVHQGGEGDCWLMSSLAAVAARNPSYISNMFTNLGQATENGQTVNLYKVRFYDNNGYAQYVTVDTMLPQGGQYYDHVQGGVLWVALAEKAYAEANGHGWVTTQHMYTDSYDAMDGGNSTWGLHAITGLSASNFAINPSNIAAAWNAGKFVCMGTKASDNDNWVVGDSQGTHAYALVGYNASGTYPYELYNPWGLSGTTTYNGHTVYGGIFYAQGGFLTQSFAADSIAGSAAPKHDHVIDVSAGGIVADGKVEMVSSTDSNDKFTTEVAGRSASNNTDHFFATTGTNMDQFRFEMS